MIACINPQKPSIPHDLRDYFLAVYWPRKLGRKERTRVMYLLTIACLGRWLGRAPTLDDLGDATLCNFLTYRLENVSPMSAAKDRYNLVAIAKHAAMKRHVAEFPDVPPVPLSVPQPTAHRPDDFEALMRACRTAPGMIGKVAAADWWVALHAVLLVTGERIGATLAIRWDWLRSDGWLSIPAEVRKGGRKAMAYRLPPAVLALIDRLRCNQSEFVFATTWVTRNGNTPFYRRYEALLDRAGLPTGRRMKPQMMRRTFASYAELLGQNATELLDHESRATTKRSYLDPTVTEKQSPGDAIAKLFGIG